MFDLTLALLLAIPAALACGLAALVIWFDDHANPFFVQTRLGRDERPFRLVKLRTMRIGTGDRPSHETARGNITRTGALMRRTKLDELPQLWNVLCGDMSFVGPRPGLPSQIELAESRRRYGVDRLLPGITGVSQVRGLDMSTPELLARTDGDYLGDWSAMRDIKLLIRTGLGSGRGDAAKL
ncbi:lipopolysaccharide/colanic/teichoic acid biosynthesis glycosyltransferase [Sphingomonas jejuensis]|uniref:Lipopolysaccharide/colanic/teichoic acid biosynthesis glycosyltransferase n=1 Tax=Sphingomonas jejuensis TaxID=904715 RepID=A0ABX0XN69_9SPHN|nr:sugar transferase [Sphingomonas jejuensis]NJC34187.1 lipopolysaccharide/colanic/teichoic acid biosynthesis glycosyltransferase [Sphingomonas jejuensis]